MSRGRRAVMTGVAVAAALLSTVGAASVADHTAYRPANDPTTKLNHSFVDDKDDDRNDVRPPADEPCPGAWRGQDCAIR